MEGRRKLLRLSNTVTIKINHANKTVSNGTEIQEVTGVWKTDNAGSRAEKMSGSSVGDSNHEYMRRNDVTKRRIRGRKRRTELWCILMLWESQAERGHGNNLANNLEINCEHALSPFEIREYRTIRKSRRKRRRR